MPDFTPKTTTTIQHKIAIFTSLAGGILILAFSPVLLRWAGAPGLVSSFYRMLIAALVITPHFVSRLHSGKSRLTKNGTMLAILGGIFFGLDLSLWSTGVMLSGATIPTLMSNLAPILVGIAAWFLYHEKQNTRFWFGLFIAISGSLVILKEDLSLSPEIGLGTILGLLSALFYGSYYIATQGGRAILDTISYFWISSMSATVILLTAVILFRQPLDGYTWQVYLSFLAMGAIIQVLGWLAINFAQGYLPASIISPTLLLQPVLTALLAVSILDEALTLWHLLGGIAVLSGILLVHISRNKDPERLIEPDEI